MLRSFICSVLLVASAGLQAADKDVEIRRISSVSTYGTSFLVKSPEGLQVVMDPYMVIDGLKADVVTVTHSHADHLDSLFHDDMLELGVPVFINRKSEWQKGDVRITGIPGMHNPVPVAPAFPSNTIFVVDTAGLRIAHFGDLGQKEFTAEQLAALGRIDIAFMQFENSWSELSASEGRAFRLMDKIAPRLIVPTHAGGQSWQKLGEAYGPSLEAGQTLSVNAATLPEKTRVVVLAHPKN